MALLTGERITRGGRCLRRVGLAAQGATTVSACMGLIAWRVMSLDNPQFSKQGRPAGAPRLSRLPWKFGGGPG
jgi:hypothetical protein